VGHQVQLATLGVFEPVVRGYGLDFALLKESPLSFIDRVIASGGNFVQRMRETKRFSLVRTGNCDGFVVVEREAVTAL
jgi:hypothetical protein